MSLPSSSVAPSDSQQYATTHSAGDEGVEKAASFSRSTSTIAFYCAKMPNSSINSICGALAGVASGIVTCPLDVIKTKLQAQGAFRIQGRRTIPRSSQVYQGMIGTARVIWTEDGFRGLYRGLSPMLLGYLPTWAVYMTVYESSKDYYYTKLESKWHARIYASITAGACSTLATNPIWVIKTRLMSQVSSRASKQARTPWHYKSTLDAARKMYRAEGIGAFYSGLTPALLGLTHVAIQFPLYEFLKQNFTGLEMGENTPSDKDVHWAGILAATFLSKICATSATYPHEVLRTRLQTQQRSQPSHSPEGITFRGGAEPGNRQRSSLGASSDGMLNLPRYRGVLRTFKVILQEEGWRAFYNGMGTNMIRAVPAAMTTMLTFETLKSAMYSLREEGKKQIEDDDSMKHE
ncbi:calcium-binding mitochondrial carrier protein Aralar2 [Patellaria atrata CBS 101060]|uniref:Calcium-binding mitochondrial carrier protein Aralar2 n=1 Tax=Patellaria atrata CBS 101060 TaxID=1346257 RepID=A0A9P4VSK9_9PEZI|nr:calcium-binding mitochondrial carrier protein Aralar2 [Patellaria atrata CBS 101060]